MTAPGAASDDQVATPRASASSRAAGASALWRDVAGGTAADPGFTWALGVGIVLVALGLLGFVPNPIVGSPSVAWGTPLLLTGDAHDVLHLVGGAVALHAAFGMSRPHRDGVLIGLGAAALILLALGLLDGRWFGIAPYAVGLGDQLLHLIVGVGSLVMGLAGTGAITVPVVTGAYRRSELGLASVPAASPEPAAVQEAGVPAEPAEPAEPGSAEILPEPLGLDLDEAETAGVAPEPEPAGLSELREVPDPRDVPELREVPEGDETTERAAGPERETQAGPPTAPDAEPLRQREPETD